MRIAFLADIHSNLPALEAVIVDLKQHAPDLVYLVGDQVVSEGEGDFYDALKSHVADIRENGCRATC